jgi:signal transduction histidine kinase
MKRKLSTLSRRYEAALRKHLKQGPHASLHPARGLGRRAVALGLETLDLARIHEGALAAMEAASSRDGIIPRAESFFAEVITPIENTHRAALRANARLTQLNKSLGRRTLSLKAANRRLKLGIARRKAVQQALKQSGGHNTKLLKKSRDLHGHLRRLSHRLLSAQEDKRRKISRELHNEIAQTLLGINVRLLALKREAAVNAEGLNKEIASTQRLVDKSVRTLSRFAREFGLHHES